MQHRRQLRRRVLLHRRLGAGVDPERNLDFLVPEAVLDDVCGRAGLE